MIFCIFYQLIWLGVGFLNRTVAEIGYRNRFERNRYFLFFKKQIPEVPNQELWAFDLFSAMS